jgi:lysophospholipase L1-like esterase
MRNEAENNNVDSLNKFLKSLAGSKNLRFLDINSLLSDHHILKENLTTDGTHLNKNGY